MAETNSKKHRKQFATEQNNRLTTARPRTVLSVHIEKTLTDSRAFSTLNTSSDNKWNVPVFPRCLANAAAQAEWMLFIQFSNSTWQGACEKQVNLPVIFIRVFTLASRLYKCISIRVSSKPLCHESCVVVRLLYFAFNCPNDVMFGEKSNVNGRRIIYRYR